MSNAKMLIDATHPEETRVVVLRNGKVEEFDYESASRKLLRGNIYLAKVTRVEPSLQAAFVEYGGNRHGFLAFAEIHPDYYQIPYADKQALLDAEAEEEAEEERRADARAEERASRQPQADAAGGDEVQPEEGGRRGGDRGRGRGRRRRGGIAEPEVTSVVDRDATRPEETGFDTAYSGAQPFADQPATEFAPPATDVAPTLATHESMNTQPTVHGSDGYPPRTMALDANVDDRLSEPAPGDSGAGPISVPEDPALDEVTTFEGGGVVEALEPDADPQPETIGDGEAEEELEEAPVRRQRRRARVYKIQEVIKKRQIILIQVVKEERGTKGAALTTYLSLAGRYTVLMPNTGRGGGISRKITNPADRKKLKSIAQELEVPEGMGLIVRTAGAARTKPEIKRDFEYLLRLWESVRDLTLASTAPSLVYEEGDLIKRSIRDLYTKDVEDIVVAGHEGFENARDFMRMLMPSHAKNVIEHADPTPLYAKFPIERQLNAMFSPFVHLRSGGYLVINQTEALVAIDINSGKATREFSIEETALNTNLEAADEIARQLKLRDLAGLIVIDFIDMEEKRNNRAVERRMKDALRHDRARIQVGRISHFGLLEMSRQRMRTGVLEGSTSQCPHCQGSGSIRSIESISLAVLRGLEDAITAGGTRTPLIATTTAPVALYLLNNKRAFINEMEARLGMAVTIQASDKVQGANFTVERGEPTAEIRRPVARTAVNMDWGFDGESEAAESETLEDERPIAGGDAQLVEVDTQDADEDGGDEPQGERADGEQGEGGGRRRRRRSRRSRGGDRERGGETTANGDVAGGPDGEPVDRLANATELPDELEGEDAEPEGDGSAQHAGDDANGEARRRGRRRGRRGGRRGRVERGSDATADGVGQNGESAPLPGLGDQPYIDLGHERPRQFDSVPSAPVFEAAPMVHEPVAAPIILPAHASEAPVQVAAVAERAFEASTPMPAPVRDVEPSRHDVVAAPAPPPEVPVVIDPTAESRLARIAPVASEPVVARVVLGDPNAEAAPPKPARRGWWSRSTT